MTTPAHQGIVRAARRPPGWHPGGPQPAGPGERADLWPAAGEDLCFLSGDFRIFQRLDGHRWSLDDLVTAWYACQATADREVTRAADLGCGIGSVLMMVAWRHPTARCLGVEAQSISVALAHRSLAYNGLTDRCEVRLGDLRSLELTPGFDLVTGTPPYLPLGEGSVSNRAQRGPCCFELRGGIEAYCAAAAPLLAPGGRFVCCEGATQRQRVDPAARAAGLVVRRQREVIPRAGKPPLFLVYQLARAADGDRGRGPEEEPPLVVRDRQGRRTPECLALREAMGLPP